MGNGQFLTNHLQEGITLFELNNKSNSNKDQVFFPPHRVMTGGVPSEPAVGARYGDLPDYDYDSDRGFSQRYQTMPPASGTITIKIYFVHVHVCMYVCTHHNL